MSTITIARLVDSIAIEDAKLWWPPHGITTTLFAGPLCKMDRDEIGWVHVRVARKIYEDGKEVIVWRPDLILLPPSAFKFAEAKGYAEDPAPLEAVAPVVTGTPDANPSAPGPGATASSDPGYRHPKAKRR